MTEKRLLSIGLATLSALAMSAAFAESTPEPLPFSKDALFDVEPATTAPPSTAAGRDEGPPASREDIFAIEPQGEKGISTASPATDKEGPVLPESRDELFAEAPPSKPVPEPAGSTLVGYVQTELAYTYGNPEHWSKVMGRLELGSQGKFSQGVNWKVGARLNYNAVYDLTDHFNNAVRNDQRAELQVRETYLDFPAGGWDWRLGRQHIVWGEMVGLFFADVVSAKDMREFILPDFQVLRIPQWAIRAEYFGDGDLHAEVAWIPFPSFDEIGRPFDLATPTRAGADFFPYPLSSAGIPDIRPEQKPGYAFDHTNFGVRLSKLTQGWDVSGFYYTSMDSAATFLRDAVTPTVFTPVHKRIWQAGGTLAKDLGDFVLKAEAVYTSGRHYNVINLVDSDGVVRQDTLDWAVGLDFNPSVDTRINAQFFQRIYFDHEPDTNFDQFENGFSLLANHKLGQGWEAEALLISSLNRRDWLLRPKVAWQFEPDWRLTLGLDVFEGRSDGFFGQYDERGDRVYAELKYDF